MELRADARANHGLIVQAATEAFAERGLGVEMKEIADRAGVAVGTIYRHFPSKEDLIGAIARTMLEEAAAAIGECTAEPNPVDGLRNLIACNLGGVARFGWLAGAFAGGLLPRHHLDEFHAEVEAKGLRQRFRPLIERGIAGGYLRPDLDVAVAVAMLEGATMPWKSVTVRGDRPIAEAAAAIMRVFLEGAALRSGKSQTTDVAVVGAPRSERKS